MTATSTRLSALKDILARVEGATEPDRSLDLDIVKALLPFDKSGSRATISLDGFFVSGSLDRCVALAERVLPGCAWRVVTDFGGYAGAGLTTGEESPAFVPQVQGATPPLAFLAAIFRALIAIAEKDEANG